MKKREKFLLVSTLVLVVSWAFYSWVAWPLIEQYRSGKVEVGELSVALAKMKADVLLKDEIDREYEQVKGLLFSESQSAGQDISDFTSELGGLYSRFNVRVRTIKIQPAVNSEAYKKLTIKMELAGNIREIAGFVSALDKLEKPIKIERLELRADRMADSVVAGFVLTKIVASQGKG